MPYPLDSRYYSPYGPVARFTVQGIQPPAAQYIGPSDQLKLTVLSPNVGCSFILGLRLLDLLGQVQPLSFPISTAATGATPLVNVITPGECFLLSATIGQSNVRRGQAFCQLLLQRGQPTGGAAVGDLLISGYTTQTDTLGFPQTPTESTLHDKGCPLVYVGATPAIGAFSNIFVPPATRWRVVAVAMTMFAPAIHNGVIECTLLTSTGAGKLSWSADPDFLTNAVGNQFFNFAEGRRLGLPDNLWASSGDEIRVYDGGGQDPGTQYGPLNVSVEEFVEI